MLMLAPNTVVNDAKFVSSGFLCSAMTYGVERGENSRFSSRNQLNQSRKSFPPLMASTEHKSSTLRICPEITAWSVLNAVHSPISSEESTPSNFLSIYWLMTEKRKRKMCLSTWYRWTEKENFQHFFRFSSLLLAVIENIKKQKRGFGPQEKNPTLLESFWMDEHDRKKLGIFNGGNAGSGALSARGNDYVCGLRWTSLIKPSEDSI